MPKLEIIFFGNGPLAEYTLEILREHCNILFHAKTKSDLDKALRLKNEHPSAHGILASFGVLIREDFLKFWEPEGILNIHPSLLPKYRGPSPIETAILNGDHDFSVSIMKLVKAMDAGPIYHQETLPAPTIFSSFPADTTTSPLPDTSTKPLPSKDQIYKALATTGANWLIQNLENLPTPTPQSGTPTFTKKLNKSLSFLSPKTQSAPEMLNHLRAFLGFPKTKYTFYDIECTILDAHLSPTFPDITSPSPSQPPTNPTQSPITPDPTDSHLYTTKSSLALKAKDDFYLIIDRLQPAGRNPMPAPSFLNGYRK